VQSWSIDRYRCPRLCVEAIGRSDDGLVVTLAARGSTYRIACDSRQGADRISADLQALRKPNSPLWQELLSTEVCSEWRAIGSFLNSRALIGEASENADSELFGGARVVAERVSSAAGALVDKTAPRERDALRTTASAVLTQHRMTNWQPSCHRQLLLSSVRESNFFRALLDIELRYLAGASPMAFEASKSLLNQLAGCVVDAVGAGGDWMLDEMGGLYELQDLDAHLTLVAYCLAASIQPLAGRFEVPETICDEVVTGTEFLRRAECLTRATLEKWGANQYLRDMAGVHEVESPLVVGCYIEEYHVTRRFVEIIAPLLHKRLALPLRALMFRYYSEEVGHEAFERTTCLTLGVNSVALEKAVPLPLHLGFVDALTLAAESDPIALFTMIMVTEGMIGDRSTVSGKLANVGKRHREFRKVSRRHDQLNHHLNHASIARYAFAEIEAISVKRQQGAISWLLFMLELNHRAWDGVASFYGCQDRLRMHGFLGSATAA
jgi:hypothetical protein